MTDRANPNLPSRDFDVTNRFYNSLGFVESWRDDGWMILKRGDLVLEFFPHPQLDPKESWFSCCLRLDDLDAFYESCRMTGLSESSHGQPRLHAKTRRLGRARWSRNRPRWFAPQVDPELVRTNDYPREVAHESP